MATRAKRQMTEPTDEEIIAQSIMDLTPREKLLQREQLDQMLRSQFVSDKFLLSYLFGEDYERLHLK